jgi:hypothetical protein
MWTAAAPLAKAFCCVVLCLGGHWLLAIIVWGFWSAAEG